MSEKPPCDCYEEDEAWLTTASHPDLVGADVLIVKGWASGQTGRVAVEARTGQDALIILVDERRAIPCCDGWFMEL